MNPEDLQNVQNAYPPVVFSRTKEDVKCREKRISGNLTEASREDLRWLIGIMQGRAESYAERIQEAKDTLEAAGYVAVIGVIVIVVLVVYIIIHGAKP